MHSIQAGLLDLATAKNLRKMSLREMGRAVTGVEQPPQKMKYHLDRLIADGYLRLDERHDVIELVEQGEKRSGGFVNIQVLGAASCGPATQFADAVVEGYLCVSEKYLPRNRKDVFAVRAVGVSMNDASINDKTIDDGDYVIVDGKMRKPESGNYVLAVTGSVANVKKYVVDSASNQIMLVSESTENFLPIFVHHDDQTDFFINGRVVDVLKMPKKKD